MAQPEPAPDSLWRQAVRRLQRNPGAMLGLVILAVLVLAALLAPAIAPFDPIKQNATDAMQGPSLKHWLGADQFGRDILSRLLFGARISLRIGLVSVGIAASIGILLGLLAGFYGGWLDMLISRFIDLLLAFPGILLALVIVTVIGPSLFNVMVAVGISAVPNYARLVRGTVLAARENVYVEAAEAIGARDRTILVKHILPNVLGPVIVLSTLGIAGAILSGAALSFLGLGAQPPTPEWGAVLSDGRNYLRQAWWISTFPGLAIMVTVLSVNLLGDGLRDALDPRMKL
ncbi:MAG: binding-protein-dependent transport system inner rane component [Firmicutes bacterium]|nr:binding-protein-dependent transport system inner rane component [Bacillota bacterium]